MKLRRCSAGPAGCAQLRASSRHAAQCSVRSENQNKMMKNRKFRKSKTKNVSHHFPPCIMLCALVIIVGDIFFLLQIFPPRSSQFASCESFSNGASSSSCQPLDDDLRGIKTIHGQRVSGNPRGAQHKNLPTFCVVRTSFFVVT